MLSHRAPAPTSPLAELDGRPTDERFHRELVQRSRPAVLRGAVAHWPAVDRWTPRALAERAGQLIVPVKVGDVAAGQQEQTTLADYVGRLLAREAALARGADPGPLPYLHDVPMFHWLPALARDVAPFPAGWLPRWYQGRPLDFAQLFLSGTGARTPLHFDTLGTHNLFFQIHGRKRFVLIPQADRALTYPHGWRWSRASALKPDLERFPMLRSARCTSIEVGPGDVLFLPAGTLHEVETLSPSVSFNIDWHTPRSAIAGVLSGLRGAPAENVFYNALIALGLCLRVPPGWVFPYYRPYLSYLS